MEKKQTAVEWLIEEIHKNMEFIPVHIQEQAIEREKQQIIDIVEKSRATGLTAEYLLLTYGSKVSDNNIINTNEMVQIDGKETNSN